MNAVKLFKKEQCDCLISIGGGSAIDTAKAIKLFLPLDENIPYLTQEHVYINLKHIAVPTTAGTGSESTRYAVVYYNGVKQSLTDDMLVPDYAVLETSFLETLPQRQKAATLFDALCQAIESLWSINSNVKSQAYAKEAIDIILSNIDCYLCGVNSKNALIMRAANLAGKAINITQTTAAHAMSYKITSLFGIPHGQAVAMCMTPVWRLLLKEIDRTNHPLGIEYIYSVLDYLKESFKVKDYIQTVDMFEKLTIKYGVAKKIKCDKETFDILVESVNTTRLKNFPIQLRRADIIEIYKAVVSE